MNFIRDPVHVYFGIDLFTTSVMWPLGLVGHRVAMSVCVSVCTSVDKNIRFFCCLLSSNIVGKYGSQDSKSRRTSKLNDWLKSYNDFNKSCVSYTGTGTVSNKID